ncbi:MAG TPA: hypothetical protein VIC70_03515 [Gaiellaceae bacterium]|jgi:hypothetical protein
MDYAIEFGGDPQDVTITLSGVATPVDFRSFIEARVLDPRFRTDMVILVDASRLDTSEMSSEALGAAMEPMIERDWHQPPLAVAIVAADARTLADAALTRARLGGRRSRRAVFTSHEEAIDWLRAQRRTS